MTISNIKEEYDDLEVYKEIEKDHKNDTVKNKEDSQMHWLEIPDTNINYPVAQGTDNKFYLDHDYYGNYNVNGSLFLDYHTNEDTTNYVIHGHNMRLSPYRPMFSMLTDYFKTDFRKNHEIIYFDQQPYRLVALVEYNIQNLDDWNYMKREFTDEEFEKYKEGLEHYSFYYNKDIKLINQPKNIITLSTCSQYSGRKNIRFLVIAQKEGESE